MVDFDNLFAQIQQRFNPQAAAEISGIFQYNLSDGQSFYCEIKEATCTLSEGVNAQHDIEFTLSTNVLIGILSGELEALPSFMDGSIIASGDLTLAPALVTLFGKTPG